MSGRDAAVAAGLLAVLSLFTLAWNVGGRPVTDLMEVRNLITAREMVDTGRWLIPTMNGGLRLEKPPLPTWAAATAGLGAGFRNLWALRAPTMLFALVGAMAVVVYTRRLGAAPPYAVAAGLVLLSMFLYARHARLATWDVPTHAFAMAAVAAFAEAAHRRSSLLAGLSGLCLAASFLSKGPMAAVMVVPWALSAAIWNPGRVRVPWRGAALFLVVGGLGCLAWPLYVYWHIPGAAVSVAIQESEAWFTRHVHPIWYYAGFPVLAGAWLPTAFAVLLSPVWFREFLSRRDVRATFAWLWMSLVVLVLVPTKKERYLIPALFPLVILIALWWESEGRRGLRAAARVMRAQTWFAGSAGAAAVAAGAVLWFSNTIAPAQTVVGGSLVLLGLAGYATVQRSRLSEAGKACVGTLFVAVGVMSAGWHIQDRLEPRVLPPVGLADAGRRAPDFSGPVFAHEPDDLYLVWAIGRPLRPYPTTRADLASMARHEMGTGATLADGGSALPIEVVAGWISTFPPADDPSLQRLRHQHVTVRVDRTARWSAATGDVALHYSRLRLTAEAASEMKPEK